MPRIRRSRVRAPARIAMAACLAAVLPAQQDRQTVVRTGDPYRRGLTDADFPRIVQLADGVYSYEQLRSAGEEKFTTVSLFVVTSDGVLVADGQGNRTETQRLIDAIAEITEQPITHLVVCSDHGDHTGGNAAFPADVTVIAHPTSAAGLERAASRRGSRGRGGRSETRRAVLATETVAEQKTYRLGSTDIQVLFLGRAHTGGDLVVYLPAEKILFMSEAYLHRIFPAMRSAYPSEWVAMIGRAQAMDVDVFVPGHGFVDDPEILAEELETFRQALLQVIAEARRLHAAGVSAEDAPGQARFGDLETWTLRDSQGATAVRRVYLELNGELPGGG